MFFRVIVIFFGLLAFGMENIPANAKSDYNSKTILINGFASAVPFIGFGFRNLQKKIPDAELYSYVGPVEGWTIIAPKVLRDVRAAYRQNPNIAINLIGVSFGANLLTRIVAVLDKENIPVSYLGILDGYPLTPVTPNVRRVDNFTCTAMGCLRDKVKLSRGNDVTVQFAFKYDTTHIELPNRFEVQRRILRQISTYSLDLGRTCRGDDGQGSAC
ncbi:MAG: hypothetical protein GY742_21380 [Hyphomicrobiales bacterium]|nr:hypothetical protein [Hyphomicrobiales bacterium]